MSSKHLDILLMSPDTDVYHIGCALRSTESKRVIIQLGKMSTRQLKFLNLPGPIKELRYDPDQAHVNPKLYMSVLGVIIYHFLAG